MTDGSARNSAGQKSIAAASNPTGAPQSSADDTLSIYTALREQLGLELKSVRDSIDVIVVDSVRAPTPD